MEETVKERLIRFIKFENISKKNFEIKCGLSNGYIGSIRKSIGGDSLVKILTNFPDLNREWLLYGEGEMLKGTYTSEKSNAKLLGNVFTAGQKDDGVLMIDYIPVAAQASFIESLDMANPETFEQYPLIPKGNERNEIESLRIFEVDGDSMYPTLTGGSLILAKEIPERSWHYAEGVVVAVYNEYVVVKRIYANRLLTDNCLILKSDNEQYGEMTVPLSDLRGLYKAKRIISSDIF